MDDFIFEIAFTVTALGVWVYSMYKPSYVKYFTKPRGELSKKSAWVRGKTTRFIQRLFWWTFPALILFLIWGPLKVGVNTYFILAGFYAGSGLLYSQRLKRQWLLWQQLGYDGPPELDQQRKQIETEGIPSNANA